MFMSTMQLFNHEHRVHIARVEFMSVERLSSREHESNLCQNTEMIQISTAKDTTSQDV